MSYSIIEFFVAAETGLTPSKAGLVSFASSVETHFNIVGMLSPQIGPSTVSIVVEPSFAAGMDLNEFLYDFYFRIWVFPLRMELRNPRVNVDIPFAVWNAYPYPNTLTSINTVDADGLTLDVEPPSQFNEIEYRTINLQILPSAPLTIDASFTFVFQQGQGIFYFIADRASVLTITPDIPVRESWQWLTNVQVSTDGTEQRIGLRSVPRRKLETKLIALDESEIREQIKKFLFDLAGQVVIPYFQYATTIDVASLSGTSDVFFDPSKTDLRQDEYVFILTPNGQELGRILTLGASGATLDAPLGINVPKDSVIMPAFASVIENKQGLRRYAVNDVAEINVNSTVSQARDAFKRPGSAAAITTFDGYQVLDKRPLANGLVQDNFDAGYERFDYQTGPIEQITWFDFTRDEGQRQYLIARAQQPAEMDYWRDFLDGTRGMLNPFLMPTYRRDLFLAATPDDGSNVLLIGGGDYASLYFPNAPYKYLYLWTANGPLCVKVNEASVTAEGNSLCTLSTGLPLGDGWRNVSFISFLLKCRLASDEVTLEHYGLETLLNLTIRTVPE